MRAVAMRVACTMAAAMLVCAAITDKAHAEFIVNIKQVGPDVVVSGSGSLDVTDLTSNGPSSSMAAVDPQDGQVVVGPSQPASVDVYGVSTGITFSGPSSFGSGGPRLADDGSGNTVA